MTEIRRFIELLIERFNAVRCSLIAGSLTFTTLLSLVPLLAVALTVMAQLPVFQSLGQTLHAFLIENFLPDKAGRVIATYVVQFSEKAASLTLVGSIALIATAILLLQTIDQAFNAIWEVKRPRPLWSRLTVYWLALTLGPVLLAGSIAATLQIVQASLGAIDEPVWLRAIVTKMLPVLLFSVFFGFLFFAVPNRRIVLWHAAIGGFVAGLGIVLLQRALGYYFAQLSSYTLLYGTFSAVPIFLVWLYSSWLVILVGALIAAVIPDYLLRRKLLPTTVSGRFYAAIRLRAALRGRQDRGQLTTLAELARDSRQRTEDTEMMLESMREAGWIAETDEGYWLLVGCGEQLSDMALFRRFVLPAEEIDQIAPYASPDEIDDFKSMLQRVDQALS
ncbi:MAG: YihY family inner membrane protein [Betaproteobacteria bacterium]|nr:YihY family inner membrane protein [Betaproteobacteria bacterium]